MTILTPDVGSKEYVMQPTRISIYPGDIVAIQNFRLPTDAGKLTD